MTQVIVTTPNELESLIQNTVRKVLSEQALFHQDASADQEEALIGIKEASAHLNLAPQTIYGFTSQRQIPFIKRGKKLYFLKSELSAWLNEGKCKTIAQQMKADLQRR